MNLFEGLELITDSNIEKFAIPGVWALFGKRKLTSSENDSISIDDRYYCLQVATTENIKIEILKDKKLLETQICTEPVMKNYVNQFKEKLFEYPVYPSAREYLYSEISQCFSKDDFVFLLICQEDNADVRKKIEKVFAHKTKAIYWRNGGSFKDGDFINFKNRQPLSVDIDDVMNDLEDVQKEKIRVISERYNKQFNSISTEKVK
ncbi:TPA: hypothetical protein ACGO7Y_002002 [Streptococcus suis]